MGVTGFLCLTLDNCGLKRESFFSQPPQLPLFWKLTLWYKTSEIFFFRKICEDLKEKMAKLDGPCFYRVDAHNVVPVWETSDQQELTPRDIRKKIMCKLGQFLTEFPPVVKHPVDTAYPCKVRYFLHLQHNWVFSIWFLWIGSFKMDGTLVFCYQNCSDLLWEKNVIVI